MPFCDGLAALYKHRHESGEPWKHRCKTHGTRRPARLHLWEVYVRTNLLILDLVHLDDGDTGGDTVSSVTHDGHEAILDEVVGPELTAVSEYMC